MALFGSLKDISTFKGISRELLENVVSQAIGYYKYRLDDSTVNIYGEGVNKYFIGPILINCLIERGDFTVDKNEISLEIKRDVSFRFLKYHLVQANVIPEIGDVVMYNEGYYHVDIVNENQLILGRDNDFAYENGLENFGSSYSVVLTTHLSSQEALGIDKNRL
jgi:hypothetical protein